MLSQTRGAIEDAYRIHGSRLWRALYAYSGDRDIATDALAEAFAQALRRGDAVRDPVAWTWRAAFRIAAGELKDRARFTNDFPDSSIEMPEATMEFVTALRRLSPRQRGALVLRYYAGYSVKEIAQILDSTAGAVRVHMSVGRRRLRDHLKGEGHG